MLAAAIATTTRQKNRLCQWQRAAEQEQWAQEPNPHNRETSTARSTMAAGHSQIRQGAAKLYSKFTLVEGLTFAQQIAPGAIRPKPQTPNPKPQTPNPFEK